VGVGREVEDYLGIEKVGKLRLTGCVGVDHCARHFADELQGVVACGVVSLVMLEEVARGVEQAVQAFAFGGVFGSGDGLAVALNESRNGALTAFDDFASCVILRIDFAHAIAERKVSIVVDDVQLVGGGGFCPAEGGRAKVGCVRRCLCSSATAERGKDGCK